MPGTVKSELLPDADRSHKCDCQEKVSWKRNLPLDKSHFITETCRSTGLLAKAAFSPLARAGDFPGSQRILENG